MRKYLAVAMALAILCGGAFAKKTNVLNVEKGELPNDCVGFKFNLSEEKTFTKGGVSLKVEAEKYPLTEGFFGEFGPKKGVWDGFDYFRFEYFNTSKTPTSLLLILKPAGSDYQTRIDAPIMLRPGKGVYEFEITGACANGGSAVDFKKKLAQWDICCGKFDAPIYFGNFQLMTADELEKLNGEDTKDTKDTKGKK